MYNIFKSLSDIGGACHSTPQFSNTGLSAYLQSRLKEPPLKKGAISANERGFQSASKPMNPETRQRRATTKEKIGGLRSRRNDSGSGTFSIKFAFVRNDS
jgi:hypothetical protein